MNIYITLDYELFFGPQSGSVNNCIIKPTQAILDIVTPYNIKLVFFVDAGYLIALNKYKEKYTQLKGDYDIIARQLKYLSENGHGIELHIHPHWEDSHFDGERWNFDTIRYKLSNFSQDEVLDIVTRYNTVLKQITNTSPRVYRAGGWSAQPFNHIKKALEANHIFIDSTVYPQGYHHSKHQQFDFRSVCKYKSFYKFSTDLTKEDTNGEFVEIPISSCKVSPLFFWRFAINKLLKQNKHRPYGDGKAVAMRKKELLRLLFSYSFSVVSIDGFKASLIKKSFKKYINNTKNKGNFVLIGHPKAFTPYSLNKLSQFIKSNVKNHAFTTFK